MRCCSSLRARVYVCGVGCVGVGVWVYLCWRGAIHIYTQTGFFSKSAHTRRQPTQRTHAPRCLHGACSARFVKRLPAPAAAHCRGQPSIQQRLDRGRVVAHGGDVQRLHVRVHV
jgi:hypothetical protein